MTRASIAVLALAFLTSAAGVRHDTTPERIQTHDNERAAGTLKDGGLRLHLEARVGQWYPHGADGPNAAMLAFAEVGRRSRNGGRWRRTERTCLTRRG